MKEKDRAVLQNQLNKKRKHPPGAQARPTNVLHSSSKYKGNGRYDQVFKNRNDRMWTPNGQRGMRRSNAEGQYNVDRRSNADGRMRMVNAEG